MRTFKKILKLCVLGMVALLIIIPLSLGLVKKFFDKTSAPAPMTAPWEIQTTSRIYLGEKFSIQKGVPELKGYWSLDGTKYTFHGSNSIIAFPANEYGTFGTDVILVQRLTSAGSPQ